MDEILHEIWMKSQEKPAPMTIGRENILTRDVDGGELLQSPHSQFFAVKAGSFFVCPTNGDFQWLIVINRY